MKRYRILSALILLIFVKFVWAVGNADYPLTSPYYDISKKNPKVLKENTSRTGQISDFNDVDFFSVLNPTPESKIPFPIADVELQFSCPQSDNNSYGWYVGLWKHDSTNPDVQLKGYDVSAKHCTDKNFSMTIGQNDDANDVGSSYYISVQSGCSRFPDLTRYYDTNSVSAPIPCDRSDYKLKLGLIPKEIRLDANTLTENELKNSIPLGSIKTGKILSMTDKNIYSVETYTEQNTNGKSEVPLLFSCTAAAARQTNDWQLTVYDDNNVLVTDYPRFINGSDCGSTLVDDKGGFKFTLPKDSPRYFVSVQSMCDLESKKNCTVETSQYNIVRDATKIYTGSLLTATKNITATATSFKLARCGLNSNSTISVKVENADLRATFKTKIPIKIQIGTMACQVLTPQSFSPSEIMLGSIIENAEIIDTPFIAKDSATATLSECISSNKPEVESKITLSGVKLDLENLNPTEIPSTNSVVIPIKVDIGDFHCEGQDAFYVDNDKPNVGDKTYSNRLNRVSGSAVPKNTEISATKKAESFDSSWLTIKKNLGMMQTGQISSLTDVQVYQVDTGTADANLTFGCLNSVRYQNDWKMLIYDSEKTLKSNTLINGSSCGIGKIGDTGAYLISLTKDSPTYYVVMKSVCENNDTTCLIDKSQYEIKRISSAQVVANESIKPCFGVDCKTLTPTKIKPFFK